MADAVNWYAHSTGLTLKQFRDRVGDAVTQVLARHGPFAKDDVPFDGMMVARPIHELNDTTHILHIWPRRAIGVRHAAVWVSLLAALRRVTPWMTWCSGSVLEGGALNDVLGQLVGDNGVWRTSWDENAQQVVWSSWDLRSDDEEDV